MTTKENTPSKVKEDEKKKATPFWKKHFLKLFLVLLIIVSLIWGYASKVQLQNTHEEEIATLTQEHQSKIQQLSKRKNKAMTQVIALAVRSELIDENKDQVSQYFNQILKQPDIQKLMLIDQNTGKVIMSTNKKDEGSIFDDQQLYKAKDIITITKKGKWYSASPVMGLNSQMATIIVVSSKL
jgi:uncharacterized membrane protein YgcG